MDNGSNNPTHRILLLFFFCDPLLLSLLRNRILVLCSLSCHVVIVDIGEYVCEHVARRTRIGLRSTQRTTLRITAFPPSQPIVIYVDPQAMSLIIHNATAILDCPTPTKSSEVLTPFDSLLVATGTQMGFYLFWTVRTEPWFICNNYMTNKQ